MNQMIKKTITEQLNIAKKNTKNAKKRKFCFNYKDVCHNMVSKQNYSSKNDDKFHIKSQSLKALL